MWTNSKTQFSVEELARLLLIKSTVPQSKICSKQPVRVSHNVSFVVDLNALDDPKDIRADENGVWQCNGSPVTYVSIHGHSILLMLKYFVARIIWAFTHIVIKFHIATY